MVKPYRYAIMGIVPLVIATFVIGFYTYPTVSHSDQLNQIHPLSIGGVVNVDLYDNTGNLYYTWEGYNSLTVTSKNALVSCITGLDTTPAHIETIGCSGWAELGIAGQQNFDGSFEQLDALATTTLLPEECDTDAVSVIDLCNSWQSQVVYDFASLECTPDVDCPTIGIFILTNEAKQGKGFDNVFFDPAIDVAPFDRLVITLTFTPT
ncbi:MAG: hypothetical protein HRU07_08450 [Nitrosopumilus sp.]|nr:hypothetical protein [Nitrosopumilus sp.]NRA06164.1 hypothetical protein [Nitrosopumilus sp.]